MRFAKIVATVGLISGLVALMLSAADGATTHSVKAASSGGVITWAEPPSATPNYIFPLGSAQYSTVNNIAQFQYLMYRPLYMFGGTDNSVSNEVNYSVSLAGAPVFNSTDTSATVTVKPYKWSNGTTVTGQDVLFFVNMLEAVKTNWYDYVPGLFPDNMKDVTASGQKVTFTFNRSYNPNWMLYNEFAQLTPMPLSWDIKAAGGAPGSGACSTGAFGAAATNTACTAVWKYLTGQAAALTTYSTSPLWGVVDGPFTVAAKLGGSFSSSGAVTLVPNPTYSGPQKASVSKFEELPFTTDNAEYTALLGGKLTVGYLPQQDLTASTSNALKSGPNNPRLTANFNLSPWVLFGFNYAVLKFDSNGAAWRRRQDLQPALPPSGDAAPRRPAPHHPEAVEGLWRADLRTGTGDPEEHRRGLLRVRRTPIPTASPRRRTCLPITAGQSSPGAPTPAAKPGTGSNECGAGIPKGAKLAFPFAYVTGTQWQEQTVQIEKSAWSSVRHQRQRYAGDLRHASLVTTPRPARARRPATRRSAGGAVAGSTPRTTTPPVRRSFSTGAASNSGGYSNPTADALIKSTYTTTQNLDAYQNYISAQLPNIWEPNADYSIAEVAKNLKGAIPQNVFANIFPEYWHFS
jgi:peptide/nickel transport system substrate-binding protein